MMQKKITIIVGLLLLLSIPHISSAQYVSATSFFNSFATARNAEEFAAAQRERSETRRTNEQAEYFAAQNKDDSETVLHAAASSSSKSSTITNTENATIEATNISPAMLSTIRALERLEKQREESKLRELALQLLVNDGTLNLHSGAPLDETTTGKGTTGKGTGKGTPTFIPTENPNLAPTGADTTILYSIVLLAISTTIFIASRQKQIAS